MNELRAKYNHSLCALSLIPIHSICASSLIPPGDTAYSDIEAVQELRAMLRDLTREVKVAPCATDTAAKWLNWPDYLDLVSKLKAEVAGKNMSGKERSSRQVAISLQRYLMFAILSCIPDRWERFALV